MDDERDVKVYTRKDLLRVLWMTILLLAVIGVVYWVDAQYESLAQVESYFMNVGY